MEIVDLPLSGLKLIHPRLFPDERGYFLELLHTKRYADAGITAPFVQDNLSHSKRGVLRGLHYQLPNWQAKLVTVITGEIYDVVVDIRRDSPTFGRWHGLNLVSRDHTQLFVPEGFAHGFCVLSDMALVQYKCTAFYDPAGEQTILATDPALGIDWPIDDPIISKKDAAGRPFADAALPQD